MQTAIHSAASEERHRTPAAVTSFLFHLGLLAILFFYRHEVKTLEPEAQAIVLDWGGGGDDAAAGLPDEGQGNDPAPPGQQMEDPSSTEAVADPAPTPPAPTPPAKTTPPKASEPSKVEVPKNTPTTTDPEVAAVRKRQEDEKRRQTDEENQRRQREDAARRVEADRQAAAAAEADRQRKEKEAKKGKFGGAFGNSGATGTGQGNTGKPGNQGVPGGTGDNPFGKTGGTGGGTGGGSGTGTGVSVGGGIGGRSIRSRPKVNDSSQKTGKVIVKVCVNADGDVTSAVSTLAGSSTTDGELRSIAEKAARQFKFGTSANAEECGTISFNFRVQ